MMPILNGDLINVKNNTKKNGAFSKSNIFDEVLGKTIFTHACELYKTKVEKGIIEHQPEGEKFVLKKNEQKTAQVEKIYFEIIKYLISKADIKDINTPYPKESTPLMDVVKTGNQLLVIDIISDKKADVNKLDNRGRSALSLATEEVAKVLVMHGAKAVTTSPTTTTTTTTTSSFGNSN